VNNSPKGIIQVKNIQSKSIMTLNEILSALRQPVPTEFISKKRVGNSTLDFISWFHYCDLLDQRCGFGNWSWEVVSTTISNNRIFLTGRLTIIGSDRQISMDATGTEEMNCSSYGDPSSNAEAMALRRCCAKFGLSRELWEKEKPAYTPKTTPKPATPRTGKEITREEWLALKANQG